MGMAQSGVDVPAVKATNSVLCLPKDERISVDDPTCLRCGKCLSACPMRLQPLYLYRYTAVGDIKELERLHQMDCIECGCCAYVCPGRLPLTEQCRRGKALLREAKAKEAAK